MALDSKQELLELAAANASIQEILQNPFLLTLACGVACSGVLRADMTRTQLYAKAVAKMFELQPETNALDAPQSLELLDVIQGALLDFILDADGWGQVSHERLRNLIACRIAESPDNPTIKEKKEAREFINQLVRKRFLLPLDAERSAYDFPHRSLAEYCAGRELADRLERGEIVVERVQQLAWLPRLEQVVTFASGELTKGGKSVGPRRHKIRIEIAERLADRLLHQDRDLFGYRLGLAVDSLAEMPGDAVSEAMARGACEDAYTLIWEHLRLDTVEIVDRANRSWPTVGLLDRRHGLGIAARLSDVVGDRHEFVRWPNAAELLGRLGSQAAGQKHVVRRLVAVLHDEYKSRDVRFLFCSSAAEALGRLGPESIEGEGVVGSLAALLWDDDGRICGSAVKSLGRLGPKVAGEKDIVRALAALLQDSDGFVCLNAALALGQLGPEGAQMEGVLPMLVSSLHSPSSELVGGTERWGHCGSGRRGHGAMTGRRRGCPRVGTRKPMAEGRVVSRAGSVRRWRGGQSDEPRRP